MTWRGFLQLRERVGPAFLLVMIDTKRQVSLPASNARAWLIDLDPVKGPQFVVLRLGSTEARHTLADHLIDIGAFTDTATAKAAIEGATASSVGVVW
jgi:hypothetical protein